MPASGSLRIGAFSRRVGVSEALLRTWERRYGLFSPARTAGGYRLYGPDDERRARRMLANLRGGMSAAESARLVLGGAAPAEDVLGELVQAWEAFDVERAHRALDLLLAAPEPEVIACRSILPRLDRLADDGDRHAHVDLALRLLETRLLAHAGGWHDAPGPLALVGAGPGEPTAIRAIAFGLSLHRLGWRIAYLGAGVPLATCISVAESLRPDRIALITDADDARALVRLHEVAPLHTGGAGDPVDWAMAMG